MNLIKAILNKDTCYVAKYCEELERIKQAAFSKIVRQKKYRIKEWQ